MMKPELPTLAFHIKSKSIPPPPEQENHEVNSSLDRDLVQKNSVIEIEPSSQENESPVNSKTILDKAKHLYVHSLDDLDSYIKSLTNLSLEDTDTRATTLTHLKDDDNSEIPKKKWVIFDMVNLGFKDDQIKEALIFLESLSNDFTKDEMLKKAVEHLVQHQHRLETVIEIEEEDRQMPSQNLAPVSESLFRLHKPPAPPKSGNHSPKNKPEEVEQKIKKVVPQEELSEISCLICYDFIPKRSLPEVSSILPCEHQFCRPCYIAYLQDKINNNKVLDIGCPYDGCTQNFEEKDLTKLLTKSEIEKYKRFKKAMILSQNPNLRWCIKEGCDKYIIGDEKTKKLVCACGMQMCYKCGNQYHHRKSCNSIINGVYKKYAKEKDVKNCPLCRSRTEKAEGCNHITCSVCSYQWCWLCKKKYTLDHYNPENLEGCPGLQHAATKPKKKITPVDIAKKIIGFVGTLLMLPFLIVFATMYLPHWLYDKRQEKKYGPSYAQNPNNDPGLRLFLSVLGLVAFPLLFIGFIVGGTAYLCSDLFGKPKIRRVQGNNS